MRSHFAVFNSDRVNRHEMMCPASELMRAEQDRHSEAFRLKIKPGLPLLIQHDVHRLAGWASPLGLYIDGSMVRVLGLVEEAETDAETEYLSSTSNVFWKIYHEADGEPFREDLLKRVAPETGEGALFFRMESLVLFKCGIASRLYPDLFSLDSEFVDKDGLVDYVFLRDVYDEVQPGVFHDTKRDLLLIAHPFFRRRLSRKNSLNQYFLKAIADICSDVGDLRIRLKLDPDVVGHPSTSFHRMELEYWRGPRFDDNISKINSGVTEHKASSSTMHYEGIDFTQVWWKAPEERSKGESLKESYRTFEIEELTNIPSIGIGDDFFGCRYSHAEYCDDLKSITHFDGAIRAYNSEQYMSRIDVAIDRAGKRSQYTKVFRFDGALKVSVWKNALDKYFRGNPLVAEYFGFQGDNIESAEVDKKSQEGLPDIALLINLRPGHVGHGIVLDAPTYYRIGDLDVKIIEIGCGAVAKYLQSHFDFRNVPTCAMGDAILNLPSIVIGQDFIEAKRYAIEIGFLTDAILKDSGAGLIRYVSVSLMWQCEDLIVNVSVAGKSQAVCEILNLFARSIDINQLPSQWIQVVADRLLEIDPKCESDVNWSGVYDGALTIPRSETVKQQLFLPDELVQELKRRGAIL